MFFYCFIRDKFIEEVLLVLDRIVGDILFCVVFYKEINYLVIERRYCERGISGLKAIYFIFRKLMNVIVVFDR